MTSPWNPVSPTISSPLSASSEEEAELTCSPPSPPQTGSHIAPRAGPAATIPPTSCPHHCHPRDVSLPALPCGSDPSGESEAEAAGALEGTLLAIRGC